MSKLTDYFRKKVHYEDIIATFDDIAEGTYTLVITKEGYDSYTGELDVTGEFDYPVELSSIGGGGDDILGSLWQYIIPIIIIVAFIPIALFVMPSTPLKIILIIIGIIVALFVYLFMSGLIYLG